LKIKEALSLVSNQIKKPPTISKSQRNCCFRERTNKELWISVVLLPLVLFVYCELQSYLGSFSDFVRTVIMRLKNRPDNRRDLGAIFDTHKWWFKLQISNQEIFHEVP